MTRGKNVISPNQIITLKIHNNEKEDNTINEN